MHPLRCRRVLEEAAYSLCTRLPLKLILGNSGGIKRAGTLMHRLSTFAYFSTLYLATSATRTRGTVLTRDDRRVGRIPLVRGRCPATLRALRCVLSEGWGHREGHHRHQKCRYRKDHKYAPHKRYLLFSSGSRLHHWLPSPLRCPMYRTKFLASTFRLQFILV